MRPHRLPSRLAWLVFATVATATISSSNTSTARTNLYDGTLPLTNAQGDDGTRIADLIPLTKDAANSVRQTLFVASPSCTDKALGPGQSVQYQLHQRRRHIQ